MERGGNKNSELANLTVSMLLNLVYFVAVSWVLPVIPMLIVLMCGWPFTAFLILWLSGLPFIGLAFYYISKMKTPSAS